MKVALAGVGHWHTPLYLDPLLALADVEVAGVCDPDRETARRHGDKIGCPFDTGLEALCDRVAPELVFVLGRHATMAAAARFLIDRRIPFVVEKPAGISAPQIAELAAAAAKAGAFAAVPLVFRSSGFLDAVREFAQGEKVLYAGFKFIAGLPSRYREAGCEWMFDRRQAGGGVLTNLGVHFLDLFQLLASAGDAAVSSAEFANLQGEGDVEDYAAVALRAGACVGRVETAYLYPAPGGIFDMHYSVRTERHYFAASGPGRVEVSDLKGERRIVEATTTNMPIYPEFVADVVRRVRQGVAPVANLADMASVMRLVDVSYAKGLT